MIKIILFIYLVKSELTPLSSCNKVRFHQYAGWENGGNCHFGKQPTTLTKNYMFGGAPNELFEGKATKCGICYELVGPSGVIRFRVDNICTASGNEPFCGGDMVDFDLSNNGFPFIFENSGVPNGTARMVACDYEGNLKVHVMEWCGKWYMEFVVIEHTIGVKGFKIKDTSMTDYIELTRTERNTWIFSKEGWEDAEIKFPLTCEITSINGDFVTVIVENDTPDAIYEANGNFKVPTDTYFDFHTLDKVPKPSDEPECCSIFEEDYNVIYKNEKVQGVYAYWGCHLVVDYNWKTDVFSESSCMKVDYDGWKSMEFGLTIPARADQYDKIHFAMKSDYICDKCMLVKALETDFEGIYISNTEANKWNVFELSLNELGVKDNKFWGVAFISCSHDPHTFYFDDIILTENEDKPDAGLCWKGLDIDSTTPSSAVRITIIAVFVILLFIGV